ncbi:MAG: hypothetical protein ACO4AI_03695 [Prochlorothrix sp.]
MGHGPDLPWVTARHWDASRCPRSKSLGTKTMGGLGHGEQDVPYQGQGTPALPQH